MNFEKEKHFQLSGEKEENNFVFENPSRGVKFEVPDFEIPDLNIPEGKRGIEKTINLEVKNKTLPDLSLVIDMTRYQHGGPGSILASLDMRGLNKKERIFSFRDSLFHRVADTPGTEDKNLHKYWHSGHRLIERAFRGKGLAEFAMLFKEALVRKLSEKYPELKAEWLEVTTDIAAVGRLVIDQEWLKDHHLDQYSKSQGINLSYIPYPDEESAVEELLSSGSTHLGDIKRGGERPIRFIKKL